MTLRKLPEIKAFERPDGLQWDAPSDAFARWAAPVQAASAGDDRTITIYDVIGEDPWTGGGFTAKRLSAALRAIGDKDVTVKINSPGGDFFEGVAIYNLLREHKAAVNVRVMGLAASAASVIAMAGDTVEIGRGAFVMIHNAWAVAVGNRHDMRDVAAVLEPFDDAMADIYAARTGGDKKDMAKLMDAETWLSASQAVELKFADGVIDDESAPEGAAARADLAAKHKIEATLAKAGMPRSERRRLLRDLSSGTPGAAEPATPRAGDYDPAEFAAAIRRTIATLKSPA